MTWFECTRVLLPSTRVVCIAMVFVIIVSVSVCRAMLNRYVAMKKAEGKAAVSTISAVLAMRCTRCVIKASAALHVPRLSEHICAPCTRGAHCQIVVYASQRCALFGGSQLLECVDWQDWDILVFSTSIMLTFILLVVSAIVVLFVAVFILFIVAGETTLSCYRM